MYRLYNIINSSILLIPKPNLNTLIKAGNRNFTTNNLINISFIQYDEEINVSVPVGISILEAAHRNNIEIEGACDGCMACSTCHVILDENVYNALPEPTEAEMDMLDLAPCLTPTSRLGCQVILNEKHDGIRIKLPRITRNFYVDGYTPSHH
ncbi:adrenodoxin-like ferredoxin [Theileria orientalis strain Shintoku]|uniref:Adrenodoxin-like ferredoxin n=1 Tax=Theileria orientalis strain Shintoku TaxID=869250 RepID=J7M8B3_THEOR|nr:adrenodoxin-like ferredoxin [Theileria orientalis strain Shintoku]BAM38693.1 adrenodoxin-like ferredoxin [Theileria orientalis strain Shintoku]|eukprot:XP_009688994.1 adrenodoxin-like ferredoxin [Theileria orientalis strain Shintoku]